jgi:4-carboxymuconolactone decarboxylase
MNLAPASAPTPSETLNARQQAIVPIAAFAAAGDMAKLNVALNQGLDSGMTVSDAREILVQLYAYAGFPRSLNALSELMKVLDARKQRGIQDAPGNAPTPPIPKGDALLAVGTANQTKLSGGPVEGPLFDFAPVANEYLRNHLFGDIFERGQPRLAKPRVGHRQHVVRAARSRIAIAGAHAHQHECRPHGKPVASAWPSAGDGRGCRDGASSK